MSPARFSSIKTDRTVPFGRATDDTSTFRLLVASIYEALPKGIFLLSSHPVRLAREWPLGHTGSAAAFTGRIDRSSDRKKTTKDARHTERTKIGTSLDPTIM